MMTDKRIVLPINLALGIGAYTTKLYIGSEQVEVNVMIDTGSSTLAIDLNKYQPINDQYLSTTTLAQAVVYGAGGWAGPVIKTHIALNHSQSIQLNNAPIALVSASQQHSFQQADGIWGMAYHHLNKSYDVSAYLNHQSPTLAASYPWPFTIEKNATAIKAFKKYLRPFPEQDITPLFDDFEEHEVVPNQFTLITQRSVEYIPHQGMSLAEIESEPLNQGQFIIGDTGMSTEQSKTIKVLHDAYYNTHLISVAVDGFPACKAPPLDAKHLNSFFSNSIIDSGCSFLVLQQQLYQYVVNCLQQIDASFVSTIEAFKQAFQQGKDYQNALLDIDLWPDLTLNFAGPRDEPVALTISAKQYWQSHAKGPNNWMFMIMNQLPQWPDQTLCGLPLINSYTCIFDRSNTRLGQIHWTQSTYDDQSP